MSETTALCLCAPASVIATVLINRDGRPYELPNSLSPLFLSRCIHDKKLTLRRWSQAEGLNGSVYAAPGSAEAGGRANPFRAATLVCTQHGPGKQNKKPLRPRSLDHIELPGYHDGVVLDKFVPFSGTKWLTNAKRFIHQPGRRGGR